MFVTLVASLAFSAVAAGSASAAQWVQGDTSMKWSAPTLTLERDGGSAVTCYPGEIEGNEPSAGWMFFGARHWGGNAIGGVTNYEGLNEVNLRIECDEGTALEFCACLRVTKALGGGAYAVDMFRRFILTWLDSPYGQYAQEAIAEGTYVNGSGEQPSTLTFDDAPLGDIEGDEITISGTIEVTQEDGSLLTLKG